MEVIPKAQRIFEPPRMAMPVFFLHIPKTSGSSNNQFLRGIYGTQNFRSHVENDLPDLVAYKAPALRIDCISGHIPLWAWHLYKGTQDYARVTLFRNPWERVVSHINWVNLFNHGVRLPRHGPGAADLAVIVQIIAETDFENRASLIALFNKARKLDHFSSFDNYQTRMMRLGAMDAMEKTLIMSDLDAACDALTGFFHFGFCEDQPSFQYGLVAKLGLKKPLQPVKANPGRRKVLHAGNTLAKEVFSPWLEYDMALTGFARGLCVNIAQAKQFDPKASVQPIDI